MKRKGSIILDNRIWWQCSECRKWKPSERFYKNRREYNGLQPGCKKCTDKRTIAAISTVEGRERIKIYSREVRRKNLERIRERERGYARKYRGTLKCISRMITNNAVQIGKLTKPSECSVCGESLKLSAHHVDYHEPLKVVWMCYQCHADHHRVLRQEVKYGVSI